jgi:hypothetical protein
MTDLAQSFASTQTPAPERKRLGGQALSFLSAAGQKVWPGLLTLVLARRAWPMPCDGGYALSFGEGVRARDCLSFGDGEENPLSASPLDRLMSIGDLLKG